MSKLYPDLLLCSDHLCLLRFLDTLCNFLPAAHCIKLLKTGQGRNRSPALFMEQEIHTVKEGVAELIYRGAEEANGDLVVSHEQWLKERSAHVQVKPYHRMMERAIKCKMQSDIAMLVEAELNDKV